MPLLLAIGVLIFSSNSSAAESTDTVAVSSDAPQSLGSITPEMDKYLMLALDCIFRMDFDGADAASRKVIELNPDHPYGYFGLASGAWTRYVYESEQTDQTLIPPIEKTMTIAIDKSKLWLKKHPKDALVMMVEGNAYGLLGRLLVMRHEWLSAYWRGH